MLAKSLRVIQFRLVVWITSCMDNIQNLIMFLQLLYFSLIINSNCTTYCKFGIKNTEIGISELRSKF